MSQVSWEKWKERERKREGRHVRSDRRVGLSACLRWRRRRWHQAHLINANDLRAAEAAPIDGIEGGGLRLRERRK